MPATLPAGEFLLPLFPLPDLVFFPETRLPLHVFEPRYRQLMMDVLEGDHRFGIVLLRPGWQGDYYGTPPVHDIGTIARTEQAVVLDDGRYNTLVRGEGRFRIVGEVSRVPYRTARVVAVPEPLSSAEEAYAQRTALAGLSHQYLRFLPDQTPVPEIETAGLEALTNALIMSLNLEVEEKQRLLEAGTIQRAEQVGAELQSRIERLQFLAPFRKAGDPRRN